MSADGTEMRETGEVAEITDLVDLSGWPTGTRMLVRREQPHPGAQLRFTDVDGYRGIARPHTCRPAGLALRRPASRVGAVGRE